MPAHLTFPSTAIATSAGTSTIVRVPNRHRAHAGSRGNGDLQVYAGSHRLAMPVEIAKAQSTLPLVEFEADPGYASGEAFNYPQVVARVIPVSALRLKPLTRL